jgi:hypothetical protein
MARIIETDNFGGDYPDEKFVNLPCMAKEHAKEVVKAINAGFPDNGPRYWMAVDNDYELQPGFEP